MKTRIKDIIPAMIVTLLMLVVLEVFSTAILPACGIMRYRLGFNILVILFFGFKLETPLIGILILIVQMVFAFFSVEGWAMGTCAGIMICMLISFLRDIIHLDSAPVTMIFTQLFQLVWLFIVALFMYIQFGEWHYIIDKVFRFIPESVVISVLSPFFFHILDKIWKNRADSPLGDEG